MVDGSRRLGMPCFASRTFEDRGGRAGSRSGREGPAGQDQVEEVVEFREALDSGKRQRELMDDFLAKDRLGRNVRAKDATARAGQQVHVPGRWGTSRERQFMLTQYRAKFSRRAFSLNCRQGLMAIIADN